MGSIFKIKIQWKTKYNKNIYSLLIFVRSTRLTWDLTEDLSWCGSPTRTKCVTPRSRGIMVSASLLCMASSTMQISLCFSLSANLQRQKDGVSDLRSQAGLLKIYLHFTEDGNHSAGAAGRAGRADDVGICYYWNLLFGASQVCSRRELRVLHLQHFHVQKSNLSRALCLKKPFA